MNRELKVFTNKEFGNVRTIIIGGDPWFIGKDVCAAFGDTNYRRSLGRLDADEKGVSQIETAGGKQSVTVINESGLYSLLFAMQPQKAKGVSQNEAQVEERMEMVRKFKRWITHEVLPSIRKHGAYMTGETLEKALTSPDFLIQLANKLKEEQERSRALQEENQRMKPKEIFADAVSVSDTTILIGELAKILKQNGIETGQNRLFEWMRQNGYLINRKGTDYNMPTQKSMELGLFEIKERAITNPDGSVRVTKTVLVTGKGQQYFVNKCLGERVSA